MQSLHCGMQAGNSVFPDVNKKLFLTIQSQVMEVWKLEYDFHQVFNDWEDSAV